MRRCGLTHKLPKNFPYRKESVQEEKYAFSLLKHPVIVVPGYKFTVLNLKCMSICNVIEHAMLNMQMSLLLKLRKKVTVTKKGEEEQQQINSTPQEKRKEM